MKRITILFLGFATLLLITSASINRQSSKKQAFEKIVFLELTVDQDSMLFKPYSKAWKENWNLYPDVSIYGTSILSYENYKFSFKDRKENLWTILHPLIIDGSIQLYYPYDPASYGMGAWDDGELRFPVMDKERTKTFLASEDVREQLCYVLGVFSPISDIPLVDEYGEPIIVTDDYGSETFKYPSPDFYWFDDSRIAKYKLRIRIEVNKKGKEKKRVIEAFCPVVNRVSDGGAITGERDLLWFDVKELKPILKEAYFLEPNWKPVSYWNYITEKVTHTDFRSDN